MKRQRGLLGLCLALGAGAAAAEGMDQGRSAVIAAGQQEYMIACAGCHGESGMGNGPLAGLLDIETPNLTAITEWTGGGAFPVQNTLLLIDGRQTLRAHGGEMPVWGNRYMADAAQVEGEAGPLQAAELVALGRMMALVCYRESIQQ